MTSIDKNTIALMQRQIQKIYEMQEAEKAQEMCSGGRARRGRRKFQRGGINMPDIPDVYGIPDKLKALREQGYFMDSVQNFMKPSNFNNFSIPSAYIPSSNILDLPTGANTNQFISSNTKPSAKTWSESPSLLRGRMGVLPTSELDINALAKSTVSTSGTSPVNDDAGSWFSQNWGSLATGAASLLGPAYNLIKGLGPYEEMDASKYYNPWDVDAINQLKYDTRVNVAPQLQAITGAENVGARNWRQGAMSSGQLFSNLTGVRTGAAKERAKVLADKENLEFGRESERRNMVSQMLAKLGADRAATKLSIADRNQMAKAARDAHLGQSFADIGKFAQTRELMSNQKEMDKLLASMYPDIYSVSQWMPGLMGWLKEMGYTNNVT